MEFSVSRATILSCFAWGAGEEQDSTLLSILVYSYANGSNGMVVTNEHVASN